MIFKLIGKDLVANGRNILLVIFGHMSLNAVIFYRHYPWNVYMMNGYLALVFAVSILNFYEKKRNAQVLACSLPVKRSTIVLARYLTSIVIVTVGLVMWFGNAYIAELIHENARSSLNMIFKPKVLLIAMVFFSSYITLFLPGVFLFKTSGTIATLVFALTGAVLTVPLIFHPYLHTYSPDLKSDDLGFYAVLTLIAIIAPCFSACLSIKSYERVDL